jgi:predicted nucleotide-binding protein
MSYYHVYIHWDDEVGARWCENIDLSIEQINELVSTIKKGISPLLKGIKINPCGITKLEIWKTEERAHGKSDIWRWIPNNGVNVTNDFIIALPTKSSVDVASSKEIENTQSKKIFIVHGKDTEQALLLQKYLKGKLKVDAVMFDDLPDKGKTIIEQLEYIQSNVGYAFVIATPDDVGCLLDEIKKIATMIVGFPTVKKEVVDKIFSLLHSRARQNVVFELGLFMGALGRDKICCLLSKQVEKKEISDIDGILYKSFEKSVTEIFHEIPDELKEAGYEIKL